MKSTCPGALSYRGGMTDVTDGLETALPALHDLYRDLHAHPELSNAEHRTAGIAASWLRDAGYEVHEGVGGTGVVGLLRNGDGPTVLLRADMDGLPLREESGLPYASTVTAPGPDGVDVPVMHGCGHDSHVTGLLGAAGQLAAHRDLWRGTVLAVFQPAEELGTGAQAMIADDLFARFGTPDVCLGQHVAPLPAGFVAIRPGPTMAASDGLRITLFGRGGHGSSPETACDPVVMAASLVVRLQTVVSREVGAAENAVVTVGYLHAGTKENIIPETAELGLSIRTFDPGVRARVLAAIRRITAAEAAAAGAPREPLVEVTTEVPVTVNDAAAVERTKAALTTALPGRVHHLPVPLPGSEDFGHFAAAAGVPSVFWFYGGYDAELFRGISTVGLSLADLPPGIAFNHSPAFAPAVAPTTETAVRALVAAAVAWLGTP